MTDSLSNSGMANPTRTPVAEVLEAERSDFDLTVEGLGDAGPAGD
ncbi:hypothetical protein [Yaniella halotolerans]|nr:hypothetical protein [Yaniella halotolerans]